MNSSQVNYSEAMQSHGFMAERKKGSRQRDVAARGGEAGEAGEEREDRAEHVLALRLNKT